MPCSSGVEGGFGVGVCSALTGFLRLALALSFSFIRSLSLSTKLGGGGSSGPPPPHPPLYVRVRTCKSRHLRTPRGRLRLHSPIGVITGHAKKIICTVTCYGCSVSRAYRSTQKAVTSHMLHAEQVKTPHCLCKSRSFGVSVSFPCLGTLLGLAHAVGARQLSFWEGRPAETQSSPRSGRRRRGPPGHVTSIHSCRTRSR